MMNAKHKLFMTLDDPRGHATDPALTEAIDELIKERIAQAFRAYEASRYERSFGRSPNPHELSAATVREHLDRAWDAE